MLNSVKTTTLPGFLDLFFPHSCMGCGQVGCALCNRCKNYILDNHKSICPQCKQPTTNGSCKNCHDLPPIYIVGERTDLLGDIVHSFKYDSIRALARPLAELMNYFLPAIETNAIIIPLPTVDRHIRERGFDHTKLVAKHLARLRNHNYKIQPLIIRANDTTQVGTNRATRIHQAASAYKLNSRIPIKQNTTYILLDDVWTTGASMQSCIKMLQQAGANQIIIALLTLSRIS